MRRNVRILVAFVLLVLPIGSMYSEVGREICDNYYTDSTFTFGCGYTDRLCDGTYQEDGTFTNYRYHEIYSCDLNQSMSRCEEFDASTGTWVTITCPGGDTAVAQGRLRIPVG